MHLPIEQASDSGDGIDPMDFDQLALIHEAATCAVRQILITRSRTAQVTLAQDLQFIALQLLQEEPFDVGELEAIIDRYSGW